MAGAQFKMSYVYSNKFKCRTCPHYLILSLISFEINFAKNQMVFYSFLMKSSDKPLAHLKFGKQTG